jgi:hypothetical protein
MVLTEIKKAKLRFGLPADAPVVACYEAGRDGFWIHRFLVHEGVQNIVVDSASIEVSRRKRRAKSDRLDAIKLVSMLIRWHNGEKKVWSVVHVPTVADEDRRQLHRELIEVIEQMVPTTIRFGEKSDAKGRDRGPGAKAAGCVVEISRDRRTASRRGGEPQEDRACEDGVLNRRTVSVGSSLVKAKRSSRFLS